MQPNSLDDHNLLGGPQWDNPISRQQHRCNIACPSPVGPINPHRYLVQGGIRSPQQDHGSGFHCQQAPSQCAGAHPKCKHCSHPANNSLMSNSKFVDAGYTTVYKDKEVNYYKTATTKIIVSEDAVILGWRCPRDKLWCVPLISDVCNLNTDRILLDHPLALGHSSLNAMYEVANMTLTCQHIDTTSALAHHREYLHNVYKLPSLEPTVCYLHAAADFTPKST